MIAAQSKLRETNFVIRLVGDQIRPWNVPFRNLSRILDAVQRLVEQRDESEDQDSDSIDEADSRGQERVLRLLDVKSGSAAYPVSVLNSEVTLRIIRGLGQSLSNPDVSDVSMATVSSLKELSEVARSMNIEIELRERGTGRSFGEVLAKIGPSSYESIAPSVFVKGFTTVYAKIERVGGATEMRCGIRLPADPRRMVICSVVSSELARTLGQFLYQYVELQGEATWFRRTQVIKRLEITSVQAHKPGGLLQSLRDLRAIGSSGWDKVVDPDAFLRELRGS